MGISSIPITRFESKVNDLAFCLRSKPWAKCIYRVNGWRSRIWAITLRRIPKSMSGLRFMLLFERGKRQVLYKRKVSIQNFFCLRYTRTRFFSLFGLFFRAKVSIGKNCAPRYFFSGILSIWTSIFFTGILLQANAVRNTCFKFENEGFY